MSWEKERNQRRVPTEGYANSGSYYTSYDNFLSISLHMDLVEQLMDTRKWQTRCLRYNIVKPEEVELCKKTKVASVESNVPRKGSRHDTALTAAIREIAPEWWDDSTRLCLNRNAQCQRHKDANKEHSYILWLGDFTGGALVFDDGTRIEEKYKWHRINGQFHPGTNPTRALSIALSFTGEATSEKKSELINERKKGG